MERPVQWGLTHQGRLDLCLVVVRAVAAVPRAWEQGQDPWPAGVEGTGSFPKEV